MEFKFNAVVSAVMLVTFAIAANCASVENPSKFHFSFECASCF